jgi:hypothetical protein
VASGKASVLKTTRDGGCITGLRRSGLPAWLL